MATEETSPTAAAATHRLLTYWAHGPGRAKIMPEVEGAWDRCHVELGKYIQGRQLDGFCARIIHEATGHWPGEHHGDKKPG